MFEPIDAYCERLGAGYWAEPVNALTNAAFLVAALVMCARTRRADLPHAPTLVALLAAIGVGSFLFHTHAQRWAALADVIPILAFILAYLYTANRAFLGLRPWPALAGAALFIPYAAALVPAFSTLPWLGSSAAYAPVPLLILIYAAVLARRAPATARGLAIGAGVLIVSLTARTLDGPLCSALPMGTHFLWHILNGLMLGWMIEVYRRHAACPPTA